MKNFVFTIGFLFIISIATACSDSTEIQDTSTQNDLIEIDYSNIDTTVKEVLHDMPDFNIADNLIMTDQPSDSFQTEKTIFRLKIESMFNINDRYSEIESIAIEQNAAYLKALEKAGNEYGVTITQEDVSQYIDENVTIVITDEKEQYAKALGISLYELDYIFERDFYVMDTLWTKLIPILMEKYQQKNNENNNDYMQRIKDEFYKNF